ncbi:MAG: hypothetical protein H6807_08415 [Planctomycetes bacterium]|nr:hypothetical protein [Planctomycetota bacterium]
MHPAIDSNVGLRPFARIETEETPRLNGLGGETFSTGESLLLRLFARLEEMRSTVDALRSEVALLREEHETGGFEREIHGGSRQSFRLLPGGQEAEVDGESFRLHLLAQVEAGSIHLARTRRNGRAGYLVLLRRSRLVRSESLGPLEERILAVLVSRRERQISAGLNARELEDLLEKEANVVPELPNSPVDSSIRSSVCRLRGKILRLGGPRARLIASEGGYRLRSAGVAVSE